MDRGIERQDKERARDTLRKSGGMKRMRQKKINVFMEA